MGKEITIEIVENGYIVRSRSQAFIFATLEEALAKVAEMVKTHNY